MFEIKEYIYFNPDYRFKIGFNVCKNCWKFTFQRNRRNSFYIKTPETFMKQKYQFP